jgi:hypothetical protein
LPFRVTMTTSDKPARPDPGACADDTVPASGDAKSAPPARQQPGRPTPDKEGGAPADELDLDGDGSRRQ